MRQTFSLLLSAAALLTSSLASAQTLTIDSINTPLSTVQNQASVTIDPATGNVLVRSASGQVCSVAPAPTASVSGPSSGQVNAQIAVNWTSTNTSGSMPCTPTSSPTNNTWNTGASAASGTRLVTLPASAGTQTLSMTCSGTTSPAATSTLSVSVSAIPDTSCAGTPTDNLTISTNPSNWEALYPGSTFPNPYGNVRAVNIPQGMTAAIAFNSGSGSPFNTGSLETAEQSGQSAGPLRMSLSRCPGDYRPELRIGKICLSPGDHVQQSLYYFIGSTTGPSYCTLTPNTTYYINLTHRIPAGGGNQASECNSSVCTTLITTRNLTPSEALQAGLPHPESLQQQ